MGRVIHVAPCRAACDTHGAILWIDAHAVHRRQVDHQIRHRRRRGRRRYAHRRGWRPAGAWSRAKLTAAITSATSAQRAIRRRTAINHRVVDRARGVVGLISGSNQRATETNLKCLQCRVIHNRVFFDNHRSRPPFHFRDYQYTHAVCQPLPHVPRSVRPSVLVPVPQHCTGICDPIHRR